jgi:hypothetical protein
LRAVSGAGGGPPLQLSRRDRVRGRQLFPWAHGSARRRCPGRTRAKELTGFGDLLVAVLAWRATMPPGTRLQALEEAKFLRAVRTKNVLRLLVVQHGPGPAVRPRLRSTRDTQAMPTF